MMNVDAGTYIVPDNQALLYSVVENDITSYKYKLASNTVGDLTLNAIHGLGITEEQLPCLVYKQDLVGILSEQAELDGRSIAVSTKAVVTYVKRFFASKHDFLSKIATVANNLTSHSTDTVKHITSEERSSWNGRLTDVQVLGNLIKKSKDGTVVSLEAYETIWTTNITFDKLEGYTKPEDATDDVLVGKYNFVSTSDFFNAISKYNTPSKSIICGPITTQDLPDDITTGNVFISKVDGNYITFLVGENGVMYYTIAALVNGVYVSAPWIRFANTFDVLAAKTQAIETAAADATTKASTAKAEAIAEIRKYSVVSENTTSSLVDGMWYIINGAQLIGTLPTEYGDYPQIKISVRDNAVGFNSIISAPEGYTINGSTDPLELDASLTITMILNGHDWLVID